MDEIAEFSNNEILILDGRTELQDYRDYWLEVQKNTFWNTVVFWGTMVLLSVVFAFMYQNSANVFVTLLIISATLIVIPILMYVSSYRSYVSMGRKHLKNLTEAERQFTITFNMANDGFECINGRNYSYVAWSSIDGATESKKQFVLNRQVNSFLLTKDLFKSQSQLDFFRFLLKVKLKDKIKLLD